jgi:hypothetical protein
MAATKLHALDLPQKLLLTATLALLAGGFFAGESLIFSRLASSAGFLRGITAWFHGDREVTPLKKEILGPMKRYFSAFEDAGKLTPAEQADLDRLLAWNNAGAPENEFLAAGEGKTPILRVLERHVCLNCHSANATIIGNRKDAPLDTYAGVARFTKPDEGPSAERLLLLSHIHLFGLAVIFLLTGLAVAATAWPVWLRGVLCAAGPLAAILVVGGWWAVKYYGDPWAPLVAFGGILMTLAFGCSVLAALYDMWIRKEERR